MHASAALSGMLPVPARSINAALARPPPAGAPNPGPNPNPVASATPAPSPGAACPTSYRFKQGDSLLAIADQYNLSLLGLLQANPNITDPSIVAPGMGLNIPCPSTNVIATCTDNVVLQPGQTMFVLADQRNLSMQQLMDANPHIVHPNMVLPGEVVNVPPCQDTDQFTSIVQKARQKCVQTTYTAQQGDFVAL